MALPASGSLAFSQVRTEFGGATPPTNLRAYLKGAGYVTASDTAPNVPTSGSISLRAFLGAAKVTGPFTASASPTGATGLGPGDARATVRSDAVTITPSGGTSPYTYAWTLVSGDTLTVSATGNTATFSASVPAFAYASAVYRCTVTDSGSRAATVDVSVYLDNAA